MKEETALIKLALRDASESLRCANQLVLNGIITANTWQDANAKVMDRLRELGELKDITEQNFHEYWTKYIVGRTE